MKVEVADSSTSKVPQFVIYAETNAERILMALFVEKAYSSNHKLIFHGATYKSGAPGVSSFHFGIAKGGKKIKRIKTE